MTEERQQLRGLYESYRRRIEFQEKVLRDPKSTTEQKNTAADRLAANKKVVAEYFSDFLEKNPPQVTSNSLVGMAKVKAAFENQVETNICPLALPETLHGFQRTKAAIERQLRKK